MEMTDHLYLPAALTLGNVSRLPTEHGGRMNFREKYFQLYHLEQFICFLFVLFVCMFL